MATNKVDYEAITRHLGNTKQKTVTASSIAFAIGVPRIYGGTMAKLVRDGWLTKAPADGYYFNHNYIDS
jgi:hypothetical protein